MIQADGRKKAETTTLISDLIVFNITKVIRDRWALPIG